MWSKVLQDYLVYVLRRRMCLLDAYFLSVDEALQCFLKVTWHAYFSSGHNSAQSWLVSWYHVTPTTNQLSIVISPRWSKAQYESIRVNKSRICCNICIHIYTLFTISSQISWCPSAREKKNEYMVTTSIIYAILFIFTCIYRYLYNWWGHILIPVL